MQGQQNIYKKYYSLLGCGTLSRVTHLPAFRWNLLHASLGYRMKAAGSFELTLELLQVDTVSRLIKLQTSVFLSSDILTQQNSN
jgi:hypothetical protein